MLGFGVASLGLRKSVGEFGGWKASILPPWAAYRELILGRLIRLNKCPGVRPVGVGETWRQILENSVLVVMGEEANEACGMEHICGGLESGIEVGIHEVRLMWQQHAQEED